MEQPAFDEALAARVAEALISTQGAKARDVAETVGVDYEPVKDVLLELEARGVVYRTGRTRGTRWWLG
jgi:sugar-specific transcriptional regulator TrmB